MHNIAGQALRSAGFTYSSIRAQTVSFEDLARASAVFVYVHIDNLTDDMMPTFADVCRHTPKGLILRAE